MILYIIIIQFCSYPFQQNNNLLYFTGFNEPDCCLIVSKSSVAFFVSPNDEFNLLWSGPRAGVEGAKEIFGIQNTFEIKELRQAIEGLSRSKNTLYVDYDPEHSSLDSEIFEKIKGKPADSLIKSLRLVKNPEELELMKTSAMIASESFKQVHFGLLINSLNDCCRQ